MKSDKASAVSRTSNEFTSGGSGARRSPRGATGENEQVRTRHLFRGN